MENKISLESLKKEVDKIVDTNDEKIDKGIKDTVLYLRALGYPTSQSCEGHHKDIDKDWGLPVPWVEIYPDVPIDFDFEDELLAKSYETKAEALKKKLEKLLSGFNKADKEILTLQPVGYGFRIMTSEVGFLEDKYDKVSSKDLIKYRKEMEAFTKYLKELYEGGYGEN